MNTTQALPSLNSSVQFSSRWYLSARESPYALHPVFLRSFSFKMVSKRSGKPIRPPPLFSQKFFFPNVAFETVSVLVWWTMALSRPFKTGRRPLPFSTPLSSWRSMCTKGQHKYVQIHFEKTPVRSKSVSREKSFSSLERSEIHVAVTSYFTRFGYMFVLCDKYR